MLERLLVSGARLFDDVFVKRVAKPIFGFQYAVWTQPAPPPLEEKLTRASAARGAWYSPKELPVKVTFIVKKNQV
jgi:hypothetical protein